MYFRVVCRVSPETDYQHARYHFVRSSDGASCAKMLVEYQTSRDNPSEVDLFIAQAVFQLVVHNRDACSARLQKTPDSGSTFCRITAPAGF